MAKLFPPLEIINKQNQKPTKGERTLLEFLEKNLDEDYEVYFQPHLNGDRPDIVLMKRGYGVLVIEVKDYNLDLYSVYSDEKWIVRSSGNEKHFFTSPVFQVTKYWRDFYNLHIDGLIEKAILNKRYYSIVRCAVFLSQSNQEQITNFLNYTEAGERANGLRIKNLNYVKIFGYDKLEKDSFGEMMREKGFSEPNEFFTEGVYNQFQRVLQPTQHVLDQIERANHRFNAKQRRIIQSKAGRQAKVKGIAGSGKTEVLANLAVKGFKRINHINDSNRSFTGYNYREVLILTFNITLRNYIHDFISNVRDNFPWSGFTICHYHRFIDMYWPKYLSNCDRPEDFESRYIFPNIPLDKFKKKYDIILVDELQDFKIEWIKSIKKVLATNGELVFFGDEKQNIYNRGDFEKEEKLPNTGIKGRWNFFTNSFRIFNEIAEVANEFQKEFFKDKYTYNQIVNYNYQTTLFKEKQYFFMQEINVKQIIKIYQNLINNYNLHSNDICFLGLSIKNIRKIDQVLRNDLNLTPTTTFEKEEVYKALEFDKKRFWKLYRIRQSKKYNFWMGSGNVKLATVHSFKGWEMQSVILIIDEDDMNQGDIIKNDTTKLNKQDIYDEMASIDADMEGGKENIDELIYTALTRVRQNLIIVNIGNKRYDEFFRKNMEVHNIKELN